MREGDEAYLAAVDLEFDDIEAPAGGHPPGSVCSRVPSSGAVTPANVGMYCTAFAEQRLIGSRLKALRAIRTGFQALPIQAHLRLFRWTELMQIVAGRQRVTGEELVSRLSFRGYTGRTLRRAVEATLVGFSEVEVRRFLLFATASSALPPPDRPIAFTKKGGSSSDALPVAHTCFSRVDMPDLRDDAEVARRLRLAVASLEDSGFGLA